MVTVHDYYYIGPKKKQVNIGTVIWAHFFFGPVYNKLYIFNNHFNF